MTSKGTTVDLPAALSAPERRMLKQYEAEADKALGDIDRSAVALGRALRDIQNEQLYRAQGTFKDYVSARFGVSKSTAYRCIQVYEWTQAHPELPVPKLWELEPGKVAAKAAPKPAAVPRVGHGPQPVAPPEPDIVDAEWSDEIPSGSAGPDSAAQLPQRTPVVDLMENLESSLAAARAAQAEVSTGEGESHVGEPVVASETQDTRSADSSGATVTGQPEFAAGLTASDGEADGGESDIGHVTEQWTSEPAAAVTPADVLARLAETKPSHVHSTQQTIDALILLLESADLDAMGAAMTSDQVDTVMVAAEELRDAWAVAHKPREKLSKGQRAKAGAPVAKVTAPSSGGLNRREVQPMFKAPKVAKG